MEWRRQDQLTVKERKAMKEEFLQMLINDKEHLWRYVEIDGIKTNYMISDDGRLASLKMCRNMSPAKGTDGYLGTIIRVNEKKINVALHRLVATAFIPNPDDLPEVNHKDGNKLNNSVSNLEWMTHNDNILHAIETGLRDSHVAEKYSEKKIHKVCKLLEANHSISNISKKTGVSKRVIRSIRRGKSWKHIASLYDISYNTSGLNLETQLNQSLFMEEQTSTTTESFPYEEEFCYKWESE